MIPNRAYCSLRRSFLLFYGETEFPNHLSQSEVMTMGIGHKTGFGKREGACLRINESIVGPYIQHLGYEHIMGAEMCDGLYLAFNAQR